MPLLKERKKQSVCHCSYSYSRGSSSSISTSPRRLAARTRVKLVPHLFGIGIVAYAAVSLFFFHIKFLNKDEALHNYYNLLDNQAQNLHHSHRPPRPAESNPSDSDHPLLSPTTATQKYGISIVRCKENTTWVSQLSYSDWLVTIYERCGEVTSTNFSVPVINKGAEDISAHMKFIVDNYDHLPPTLIFLQPDAFMGYRSDRTCAHTPFHTIKELTKAVDDHLRGGYLSLSPSQPISERLIGAFYHGSEMNRTWSIIFPNGEPITQQTVSFGHGSHFAVSRERVLSRHRSVYANIEHFILEENADARRRACAVERLLHVLFGEPIIIPKESYMRNFIERTEGCPN